MSLGESVNESAQALRELAGDAEALGAMEEALGAAAKALRAGKKLMFCGNGGSAADAQHAAGELVGRFKLERKGLAAVALTTDASILTAVGNDFGFDEVFARQVEALGGEGDVLFVLSTSGNAENVLRAVAGAREKGILVVGLTGRGGGKMRDGCDILVRVPADSTPRVQECHEALLHAFCGALEEILREGQTE